MKKSENLHFNQSMKANLIIKLAAKTLQLSPLQIRSISRTREVVDARRICYSLIRETLRLSYTDIASIFKQDHSNVVHHIHKHYDLCTTDIEYKYLYDLCKTAIGLKDLSIEKDIDVFASNKKLLARVEYLEEENKFLTKQLNSIKTTIL